VDTPIFMHGEWEDNYDDPSHPIPSLTAIDVHGVRLDGGADLAIVVASPLRDDERSRGRLLAKIEAYVQFLSSPEFVRECGAASPANTTIMVSIHPDSDPEMFDLIDSCRGWVEDRGASLALELRHTSIQ
jgi:hypothetical protein